MSIHTIACDAPGCSIMKTTHNLMDRGAIFYCALDECVDICHSCFSKPDLSEDQRACFVGLEEKTTIQRCSELSQRHTNGLPALPQLITSSRWWRMLEAWGLDAPPQPNPFGPPAGSLFGFAPVVNPGPGGFNPPTAFMPTRPKSPPLPTLYEGKTKDGKSVFFELPGSSPMWRLPEVMRERNLRGVTKLGKKTKERVEEERLAKRSAREKKQNPHGLEKGDQVIFLDGCELPGAEGILIGIDADDGIVKLTGSSDIKIVRLKHLRRA